MNREKNPDYYLHMLMCLIGGFMGAYALLNRGGNFGSSQTANLIYLVFGILGHNVKEILIRFTGMFLYLAGIELCVILKHKTRINLQRYSILINLSGFVMLNFISPSTDPITGILPLFFIMSTQWSVFNGANGYTCSTIFSTNNFRQAFSAAGEYIFTRDVGQLEKFQFFGISLLSYHAGVVISYFSCRAWGIHASLLCIIPGLIAFLITCRGTGFLSLLGKRKSSGQKSIIS